MTFELVGLILKLLIMAHHLVLVRRSSTMLLDYRSNIEFLKEFTLNLTVSIVVVLNRLINRVLIWLC